PRFEPVLSTLAGFTGDTKEKIEYYEHWLAVEKKLHGTDDPNFVTILGFYASSLQEDGQYLKSAQTLKRVAAIREKIHEDQSPEDYDAKILRKFASGQLKPFEPTAPRYLGRRTRRKLGIVDSQAQSSPDERERVRKSEEYRESERYRERN